MMMINMDETEHKKHFKNALSNYSGVLAILDRFDDEQIAHSPSKELPADWEQNHLLLYGEYLAMLDPSGADKGFLQKGTDLLIEEKGARWVWDNRRRLTAEQIFLRTF